MPEILDKSIIDKIVAVSDEDAYLYARKICKSEGICVGISSGAALAAAVDAANQSENAGKNIVAVLPDTGSRYLSTDLF